MPKKILLADDSITIQKVVELTFSDGDYEVTAVNNGAKAIARLGEMRPDIILSDIIMPEKNGYEVCEYVKSHPEFRNIPVVLLTGTFEPFDPDRAEKAGCDAVVTKPFESQSLIHKVEELIAQAASAPAAQPAAFTPAPEPEPMAMPEPEPSFEPSPWMDETATVEPPSPFTTSGGSFPTPGESFTHDADIFAAAPPSAPTTEMPFEPAPSFDEDLGGGETRAFPKMSFDDFQTPAAPSAPPPPPPPAPAAPWGEPASSPFGEEPQFSGETRAFEKMSFDDLQQQMSRPAPEPEPQREPEAESPFGAPPPVEEFSGETRAFPRMTLDELQQPAPEPEVEEETPVPVEESSPWDEPAEEAPMFGGETRAFPKMSFDDLQQPQAPETSPWDEPSPSSASASPFATEPEEPAFGGETRAFPKIGFDDLQSMQTPMEPEPPAWSIPEPEPEPQAEPQAEQAWQPAAETSAPAMPEDLPFGTDTTPEVEPQQEPMIAPVAAAEAFAEPEEPAVPPLSLAPETPAMPIATRGSELSDDQIDRIARRVIELMSDQVVRNIAWEVIPDLAEMVVKERIRQLESEA